MRALNVNLNDLTEQVELFRQMFKREQEDGNLDVNAEFPYELEGQVFTPEQHAFALHKMLTILRDNLADGDVVVMAGNEEKPLTVGAS